MEKIIKIGNQEVKLSNNVAWLMEYREQFGKDATQELIPLMATAVEVLNSGIAAYKDGKLNLEAFADAVEGRSSELLLPLYTADISTSIINITWAMAKAADETIDPPKKWVRQFDSFPFDEIVPQLWTLNAEGFSSSKNLEMLRTLFGKAKTAWNEIKETQHSDSTTLSSPESNED